MVVDEEEYARVYTARHLAGWGLALSLALCIPFVPLVGMGLGIAVLVRFRGAGPEYGKGMAIAATVIGGVLGTLIASYFVYGLVNGFPGTGPDRDEEGQVKEPSLIEPADLRKGDCFNDPQQGTPGEGYLSELVEVLPCDEPHEAEVFHVLELELPAFPTTDELQRESRACRGAFRDYVGDGYAGPPLVYSYFSPSERDWNYLGDRTMHCVVLDESGEPLEGSVAGGARL